RNADQVRVGELESRALRAIVEQHVETRVAELRVRVLGGFPHVLGLVHVDRDHDDVERRDRLRPDDAALIMVLLDRRGYDTGHTDAVAAPLHGPGLALGIEHGRAHRAAVLVAELEDLPDLYAAGDRERAAPAGARVAGDRVTQVRDLGQLRVALPVDAAIVV